MINKVAGNSPSFSGKIIMNPLLSNTINYFTEDTNKSANSEIACAGLSTNNLPTENLSDALEYIINETPDSDVFELRKHGRSKKGEYQITLYRNNEPIVNKKGQSSNGFKTAAYTVYNVLNSFYEDYKLHPVSPLTEEIKKISDEQSQIHQKYSEKYDILKKKFDIEREELWSERNKKYNKLQDQIYVLTRQRIKTANQKLADIKENINLMA